MKGSAAAALSCLAVALTVALSACGQEPNAQPASGATATAEQAAGSDAQASGTEAQAAAAPAAPKQERWLLAEFDWGDTEAIVYESVQYTDGFLCYRHKLREHCAFVKTKVDGEELLAEFEFANGLLWRIDVLTPELDAKQAQAHLERVWKLLATYVTRFYGEAPEQAAFPQRDTIAAKQEVLTHRWVLPEQEIHIFVGRSPNEPKWFTAARFIDPKWAKRSPPPPMPAAAPQPSTASPTS